MSNKNIMQSSQYTQIILDNITDGGFTTDLGYCITSFNKAAERITGIPREKALGQKCHDVFRASVCEKDCPLRKTMKTSDPLISKKIRILNSEGNQVPISVSTALLRDKQGVVIGGVETFRDQSVVHELRKELEASYTFSDIISKNSVMLRIFSTLPQIAESDSCVLIEGESGTGKELFARVIHNLSRRKKKKLVAVNCGALPDTLLESELFGYKAGAFTDAKKDKMGRFAQAKHSTILLDEIGDISPAFQVRLLRVLQDKEYEPLGSVHSEKADVRVLASTNKNLMDLVNKGVFRQDLFYRINVIRIVIPPLRERKEDISQLVKHFISKFNRLMGKNIEGTSMNVMRILMKHNYPGNVRELENILEHSMVLCRNTILEVEHLPPELTHAYSDHHPDTIPAISVDSLERQSILAALKRCSWNRQAAADDLGIHKTTLFRKVKALKILLPKKDGRNIRNA